MMFNVPDKWSPLKSVVLGRGYSEQYMITSLIGIFNLLVQYCITKCRIAHFTSMNHGLPATNGEQ